MTTAANNHYTDPNAGHAILLLNGRVYIQELDQEISITANQYDRARQQQNVNWNNISAEVQRTHQGTNLANVMAQIEEAKKNALLVKAIQVAVQDMGHGSKSFYLYFEE